MSPAEQLSEKETELAKLQKEYDGFKKALGDPKLTAWVADRGRAAPRSLSAFEVATVKRLASLEPKIDRLAQECEDLFGDVVCEIAGIDGEPDDPELLLRAAMIVLSRLHKTGRSTPESRVVTKALLMYLKSLANDDEEDD